MKQPKMHKTGLLRKIRQLLGFNGRSIKEESVPMRSEKARNPLIVFGNFVFMLAIFCVLIAALGLYSIKALYERSGSTAQPSALLVPAGFGVSAIADLLRERGFISNAQIFIYGTYLEDKAKALKAGEYEIPAGASMREIADILVSGRSLQYMLTLPEGMTAAQIFAKLESDPRLTGSLPETLPPEGSLLTNTVKFTRGASRQEILRRLEAGQKHLVQEIWAKRAPDLPLENVEQMVILASIIEKETGLAAERPQVAAVFYNRLRKKMRLQSDPTILYGLFGSAGKPANRPIYHSDLEKETAYNTYKIFGLPPTPICNPGRDSLLAAANPAQTDDLYFVADGSGGHIFAKTLNEHNSNVSKWRALRRARENMPSEASEDSSGANNTESAPQAEQMPAETQSGGARQTEGETEPKPKPQSAVPAAQENMGAAEKQANKPARPLLYAPLMRKTAPFAQGSGLIQETP